MADLISKKVNDVDVLALEQTLNQTLVNDGHVIVDFATENTFVDKNIHVDLTVPTAAAPASLDVEASNLAMGTAANGVYTPTVDLSGDVNVATAGWMAAGDKAVSKSSVTIGTINQSTLKNGNTAINSGANVVPAVSDDQTINITEGYEGARTVIVKSMDSADTQKATVASGNATISTVSFDHNASGGFDISATETIPAPGVTTPGFISTTAGTKTAGTATVAASVDKVTVGVSVTGDGKVTPVITRTAKKSGDTWVDAASGAATTTKPSVGAYVQVDAAAINKAASVEGIVSAAGYGTTTNYQHDAATSVTAGSNAAVSTYVPIAAGTVAANGAEINTVAVAYNSTAGNFDVTGSANIPAPTVSTAGYVGNSVGTVSGATDGAVVDASIAKIGIGTTISGGNAITPVISKGNATNVDASAATTTQPSSGFYVAVGTAADTSSVTATAAVTSAGYGTTTAGQYTATGDSATINVNAATAYIPITGATFANAAVSGHTYTDISSTAPVLISEDYLYINKGYTNDVKISLAQLVPNDATIVASTGASYVLSGQSAYDKDGKLIVGSIPTYNGAYTIA